MTIGAVILVRMSSSRLPGKPLFRFKEKTLIDLVMQRLVKQIPYFSIIVAMSDEQTDDILAEYCTKKGYTIYRGSEKNVAKRFLCALEELNVSHVLRINGDNLFVNIDSINVFKEKFTELKEIKFFTNVRGRPYPPGMSVEIVSKQEYRDKYNYFSQDSYHSEHVMTYFYENWCECYVVDPVEPIKCQSLSYALDTLDDYSRLLSIYAKIESCYETISNAEILSIIKNANRQ